MTQARRKPIRPRDAASLVVFRRESDGEPAVLMGRREPGVRFMPGFYVFPGGAVERSDGRVQPACALDPSICVQLKLAKDPARARRLAISAVRETFEETGLMVAAEGNPSVDTPAWAHWRARGLAPKLSALDYFARAITPPRQPIRFHARFFLVESKHLHGELETGGELEDIGWFRLSQTAGLKLADIQRLLIEHLRVTLDPTSPSPGHPMFSYRDGRRLVTYT